jgi:hypothetical protein
MMDELISGVCTKAGLSQDQARSAVDVLGLLKNRLPAPRATYHDSVSCGSASAVADGGSGETRGTKAEALRIRRAACLEIRSAISDEKDKRPKGATE